MTATRPPVSPPPGTDGNLVAASWMTGSMLMFAIEDTAVKALGERVSPGQIVMVLGIFGLPIFWTLLAREGHGMWNRNLLLPAVLLRNLGELIGALCYVSALALTDLASASAILQALPLALVLGAALFLGERVGWRRWLAIGAGFLGVLLIIRPGSSSFEPASILALIAVVALAMRDLATRRMPRHVPSHQLSGSAYGIMIPGGLGLSLAQGHPPVWPTAGEGIGYAIAIIVGALGYAMMVRATRVGEASAIAPFRYTRLVFALILAVLVFRERPDAMTLIGAAVIVAAGSFAMWREFRRNRTRV